MKQCKFHHIYLYRNSTKVALKICSTSNKNENGEAWFNYNFFFNLTRLLSNLLLNNYTSSKVKDWLFLLTPKKATEYQLSENLEIYYISSFKELKPILEKLNRDNKEFAKYRAISQKLQYYRNSLALISSFKYKKEPLFTHNSISQTKSPINRRIRYCLERIPANYVPEPYEDFIERIYREIVDKLTELFFNNTASLLGLE